MICTCYCSHTHTHKVYQVSLCCHGHTRETQHDPNTTVRHATCVVSLGVRGPGGAFCSERACVCVCVCQLFCTEGLRRPTHHPPAHASTHTAHGQPIHDTDVVHHVNKSLFAFWRSVRADRFPDLLLCALSRRWRMTRRAKINRY